MMSAFSPEKENVDNCSSCDVDQTNLKPFVILPAAPKNYLSPRTANLVPCETLETDYCINDDNVAGFVTIADDDTSDNEAHTFANSQDSVAENSNTLNTAQPVNEVAATRKVHYRNRHHPLPTSDLKNLSRFSATGVLGTSAVVRDCKMSISSSPPSPSAGTPGGSLCDSLCGPYFKPVQMVPQNIRSLSPGLTTTNSVLVEKLPVFQNSCLSTSTIFPPSTCSSSPASGMTSKKRKAEEDLHQYYESFGCSSSDVDQTAELPTTSGFNHQQCKRSKNDHQKYDNVIITSPLSKAGMSVETKMDSSKSKVSLKKPRAKKTTRKPKKNQAYVIEKTQRLSSVYVPQPVTRYDETTVAPWPTSTSCHAVDVYDPASPHIGETKGYFLRSSVKKQKAVIKATEGTKVSENLEADSLRCVGKYDTPRKQKQRYRDEKTYRDVATSTSQKATTEPEIIPEERPSSVILSDVRKSSSSLRALYDVKGKIGVGGGGTVYAATRKADNVEVAIKRVPKDKVKRFGRLNNRRVPIEFELLHRASLSGNAGVIKMYDWFERNSSYVLVMERPQPVIDLFDYLNQHGALDERAARKIFRQVVEAVVQCHNNGVLHRDIKDENLLLNLHTSEVTLIDFGCGTYLKDEPYREFAGTFEFYPPEWFTDRRYIGWQLDAWSLGVLLYLMINSEVPFPKQADIVECKLSFKKASDTVSETCRDLIRQMLQKDPTSRPTLYEVLSHAWLSPDFEIPDPTKVNTSNRSSLEHDTVQKSSSANDTSSYSTINNSCSMDSLPSANQAIIKLSQERLSLSKSRLTSSTNDAVLSSPRVNAFASSVELSDSPEKAQSQFSMDLSCTNSYHRTSTSSETSSIRKQSHRSRSSCASTMDIFACQQSFSSASTENENESNEQFLFRCISSDCATVSPRRLPFQPLANSSPLRSSRCFDVNLMSLSPTASEKSVCSSRSNVKSSDRSLDIVSKRIPFFYRPRVPSRIVAAEFSPQSPPPADRGYFRRSQEAIVQSYPSISLTGGYASPPRSGSAKPEFTSPKPVRNQ